jgi:hypothetical protein
VKPTKNAALHSPTLQDSILLRTSLLAEDKLLIERKLNLLFNIGNRGQAKEKPVSTM